jgi:formylglycine-generating enzyme required for sulfatase activity
MKKMIGVWLALFAVNIFAVEPVISHVTVRQRWPWSRLVDIDYVLTCDADDTVDVTLEAFDGTTPLPLPIESMFGDRYGVRRGARRIIWDPGRTAYSNDMQIARFNVRLTPVRVPLYLIVSLTTPAGGTPVVEPVFEKDLHAGLWGTVVTNPVEGIESIAWTGVTNGTAYKTDALVLRRVPAGRFLYAGNKETVVSNDFYVSVFELTQGQRKNLTGAFNSGSYYSGADRALHPEEKVSYVFARGAESDTPPVNWPVTGSLVSEGSLAALLRAKSGLLFDLPDKIQWEYACRAGTTTLFNSGSNEDSALEELGWYNGNAGGNTKEVGLKKPNAWGLYDMHGNIEEFCLDWHDAEHTQRHRRNGSWYTGLTTCAATYASGRTPINTGGTMGFRFVAVLP